MKYLSDYTQEGMSKLLIDNNAFFAFGQKQFDERKIDGIKYVALSSGLFCPKENAGKLVDGIIENSKKAIDQDLRENGKEEIIKRELRNHEAYYDGDISRAVEALSVYSFAEEDIRNIYIVESRNISW